MRVERYAQEVFFDAMKAGYIDLMCLKTEIPQIFGSKHILYTDSDWTVTDTYVVSSEGDGSGGMTVVSYDEVPVWMMQYGGRYPTEVIPFLKEALAAAYRPHAWTGGRGPVIFQEKELTYVNIVEGENRFSEFSGMERILDKDGKQLGFHRYHGGWLYQF